jgi:uncharacterized membrane protein YeiH
MAEPVSTSVGVFAGIKALAPALVNFLTATAATTFGALVSVYVYRERKWWEHVAAWPIGLGLSYWVVGGIAEYTGINQPFFIHACSVLTGVFGVAILMEGAKQIPLAADAARVKWLGGTPKGEQE